MASSILHIVVNYKNDADTRRFVSHCKALPAADRVHFVIVNNSAIDQEDSTFSDLKSAQVEVINCPENPGYLGGAARAYNKEFYRFVILSNTDLNLVGDDFYRNLLAMRVGTDIGMLAPSIVSELTKAEANPLYWSRPTANKMRRLKTVYSSILLASLYHLGALVKSRMITKREIQSGAQVYAPHGCFMIFTEHYFAAGGDFQYPVKLYGEEIFLAEKLRKLQLRAILVPELKVIHREKGSESSWVGRWIISRTAFKYKLESSKYLASLFED